MKMSCHPPCQVPDWTDATPTLPARMSLSTDTSSLPPARANVSLKSTNIAPSWSGYMTATRKNYSPWEGHQKRTTRERPQIAPESIPCFSFNISITQTPVSVSPFNIAYCIGAGPLYAGRREGWTFSRLVGANRFNNEAGRIRPNDAVTTTWLTGGGMKVVN